MDSEDNENVSGLESEDNIIGHANTIEHEWEIISRLYNGQNMQVSVLDMLGRSDVDRNTN